jgi:uncharacterized protein
MIEARFVFDTNAVVSAVLLPTSVARQAFDRAQDQGRLLVSPATLQELHDVLKRGRFDKYIDEDERMEFLAVLVEEALLVEVTEAVVACRDPKDDKFLELAISGGATCIVTGDKDLLTLHPFRGIPIITPQTFLQHSWATETE